MMLYWKERGILITNIRIFRGLENTGYKTFGKIHTHGGVYY